MKQAAEDIFYAWADVTDVPADPIGLNGFDARKLAFLEAFSGQEIAPRDPQTGAVSTAGLAELEDSWTDTLQSLTLRLVVQSSGLPAFSGMTYRDDLDLIVMGGADTLKDVYANILSGLSTDSVTALTEWEDWGGLLKVIQQGSRRFDNNIVRDDFAAAQLQAAIAASGTTFDLATLAPAVGIGNLRIGTSVAETLTQIDGDTIFSGLGDGDIAEGGTGQDVYLLESGFGAVTIDDEEGAKMGDRIRFVDIDRSEVSAARVGDNLVLTVDATGDTVTVLGQFADVVPLSSDVIISNNLGVEEIQFADGAIMELPDIAIAVGEGTSGDDVMHGTMHTDVFQGHAGNDLLMGGDDADLYVFDLGDGVDIIREEQTNPLLMAADMVIFGEGIAPEELIFARGADENDLVITIGSGGDSVTIDNQFGYSSLGYNHQWSPNTRVEIFSFRHYGDVYTHSDIQQQLIASVTTDGDDVTRGFGDDDFFGPSLGNDTFIGHDGNDTYLFGRGFGDDTIDEQAIYIDVDVGLGGLSLEQGADTIVFAPDIHLADVTFSRLSSAPHLTITLDTGETLTVENQFNGFQTGTLGEQWFDRIEWFEFGDGTRISWQDVLLDVTSGTDGDDSLWGDLYEDTLTGGLGNDYLSGGGYADTYIFNLGDGQDVIDDDNQFILREGFVTVDTTPDILRFGVGITVADIAVNYDADHVFLLVGSGGDSVTLHGQNDYYHTGVFGAISNSRIELIEFADGTSWTWQDLNALAIASATTAGDDTIVGFDLEDRFEASSGNDIMRGGDSGDTYAFGIGSGSDRIEETVDNANFDDNDRVEFEAGLTRSDIAFERSGKDLIVRINGSSDDLTIAGQFDNYVGLTNYDIETFHFADGTVVTKAELMAEFTVGTSGDDTLDGFYTNDTIVGGLGNDILSGKDGSDTYIFNLGDGQDTIKESVEFAQIADDDRIVFGAGILPSAVSLSRSGNALTVTVDGTTDSITVEGQFAFQNWFSWTDIEFFEFADGTVWTKRDVANSLMGGTSGDDTIFGTPENDELNGMDGNDILQGGDGSDIYYFGLGYGHDTIEESVDNANLDDFDQIVMAQGIAAADLEFMRDGDALTISIAGTSDSVTVVGQFDNYIGFTFRDVEQIQFSDGSIMTKAEIQNLLTIGTASAEVVTGFHTDDFIDGGADNDILRGMDGSDTYFFGRGSGNDIIQESVEFVQFSDDDRVQFASDIAPEDVVWSRSGADLIIGLIDSPDTITVESGLAWQSSIFGYTWHDIESFAFDDGTVLILSQVAQLAINPTDGDDFLEGSYFNEQFFAGLGNDVVRADAGNDVLHGGEGDDLLAGGDGSDELTGGPGSDTLHGGGGNDSYFYSLGDGNDIIADFSRYYGEGSGGFDRLYLGDAINPEDIVVSSANSGADVLLTFAQNQQQLVLSGFTTGTYGQIEEIVFASGTIWDYDYVFQAATGSTSGDDVIYGDYGANTLLGGAGNDTIYGVAGSDTLIGGAGDDVLDGGSEGDTYVYARGDGNDLIYDWGHGGDVLEFGAGIAPEDLAFGIHPGRSADLVISLTDGSGSVRIYDQLSQYYRHIEQLKFADGTVWNNAQINARLVQDQTSDGNDYIYGSSLTSDVINGGLGNDTIYGVAGSDTLIGGAGDDVLDGGSEGDTYVYARGDGNDLIYDWGHGGDVLEFGAGIAPEDLAFGIHPGRSADLVISLTDGSGSVRIYDQLSQYYRHIEQLKFADGTVWNNAQINARLVQDQTSDGNDYIYGSSLTSDVINGGLGNDTIYGVAGSDTLIGGAGDDVLDGGSEGDTYVYARGDGNDLIYDWGHGGDVLEFGAGIAPEDLAFGIHPGRSADLVISLTDGSGSVRIYDQLSQYYRHIEQLKFADGTVWNNAQINARLVQDQTSDGNDYIYGSSLTSDVINGGLGNDTIYGVAGSDTLIGGAGDDVLDGGSEGDTYVYARGDGNDLIYDWGHGGDVLEFGAGIAPDDLVFGTASDGADLLISLADGSGSIRLNGQLSHGNWRIEELHFADGTVWDYSAG